jgi:RNA polymerase sigma factor (sigma-70 family)
VTTVTYPHTVVPLVERAAQPATGDNELVFAPETWEDVVREHGQMLYGVAYRLTGNEHDARDLVQDVLIKVHNALPKFQPGSFTGWLYRITVNTFLDSVRKQQRVRLQAIPDDLSRFSAGEQVPSPPEVLAQVRLDDDIQRAVNELPSEFKAAVVMCDVVGLSYEDIATQLDVPIGTVRSRIHRGRALLRRSLSHRLEDVG